MSDLTPPIRFASERVRDLNDRRKTVYWRWFANGNKLGAVSEKPGGWRALVHRYAADGNRIIELGMHSTRRAAEQAVKDWASQNPERIPEKAT